MSYAALAGLAPQYGLYSAFVGVFIYCFFATSKDVTIVSLASSCSSAKSMTDHSYSCFQGPVAVMSLQTGKVIAAVQATAGGDMYTAPVIATALAFMCGFIVLAIGLLRLGFIVEFIPTPAVSGFMTGSAISIIAGQLYSLFGIPKATFE